MPDQDYQNHSTSRRRSGLHQEIFLTLVLLLGAALLFGGVLFLRFAEQNLLESHLKLLVQGTRATARAMVQGDEPKVDQVLLQQLQTDLHADSWWLYNHSLQLVGSVSRDDSTPLDATRLRGLLQQRDDALEVAWPGLLGLIGASEERIEATVATPAGLPGSGPGLLVVRFSLEPIRERLLGAQRWVFFYALGYGLVLAAAGFFLLRRNVIQPVKNLLLATEKVTGGDLDTSLSEQGPAEIADLAVSFNTMTTALRQSRKQTEEHICSLEEANQRLKKTQEELVRSEKLATVGHLAAGMAHEIGNPLGALTGYLALLQSELPDGPEKEIAGLSVAEAERIDRLVRDLLDYAAPGQIDPDPIEPWPVVLDTLAMLNAQGALKGLQVKVETGLQLPPVAIDRHKLTQVLVNLLLNSRDSCGDKGAISLTGRVADSQVVLDVEDNGAGISTEVQSKLFEPFFTTKAPGKGRGLGLAVCQRVIAEAGGEILVVSDLGQGSCFSIALPIAGVKHG
jgi:signal transduction histidine kinase